jgi:copper chaperone CopZ
MRVLKLQLSGLTCQVILFFNSQKSCVESVKNALFLLPGMEDVSIQDLTDATIEYDDSLLEEYDIVSSIEDAGFEALLRKRIHVAIHGMTCNSCVVSIQNALQQLSGKFLLFFTLISIRYIYIYRYSYESPYQTVSTLPIKS